ncbi:acetyltransferase [Marinobacter oulmenensis]|uniref:Acetyltransferase n=1 Tax=Marinobacter oulmenensis TaxID=643747 RepID=A0A840UL74_9GAMM|nr:acetyltransferase [Marinobacter oulmenensis]MBB5321597.1 hypothetical protein [Marinobacter oulmenensis]
MFVADRSNGHLIEVLDTATLFDPHAHHIEGRLHYGEEVQDTELFDKSGLVFPSGESLPACWTDPDYRRR